MTPAGSLDMLPEMSNGRRLCGLLVALLPLAAGCSGGTETGNPSLTGQLSYTGVSSAPTEIGVRDGGRVANVKRAWLDLAQVTVSSSGPCGLTTDNAFTVDALGVGDHAAGIHNATTFKATGGAFCSLELPFLRVSSDDMTAPAELRGHAIVLTGELADGTPFSIESDQTELVRLQAGDAGFDLSSSRADALLAFDFAAWLKGVDFAAASLDAGSINVSETSNTAVLRAFEAQLASGVALYRDRDQDGVIDDAPELLATAP